MLVDFCHYSMGSKIISDKVSFDGYEVTNLLARDHSLKNKGFLSDHFIKPPVNVTVEFPCNIAIYRIVIDPVIGRQQSCDIKLFTGTKTISKSWLYGNEDNTPVNSSGLLLNRIGFISSSEPFPICFQNPCFKEKRLWKVDNFEDMRQCPIRSELIVKKPGSLCNVSHLNICVTRVKSGGTVAIKRLEVWGMPAFCVPDVLQQWLLDVFQKTIHAKLNIDKSHSDERKKYEQTDRVPRESSETASYVVENGVEIPEDFIDQITYEIMAVPMLLPCGKNIDQFTLEQFINTEASWGRAPSDPFTGVLFSPGHQVVPNTALKARLDQFLLKNSDKLRVARTLGSTKLPAQKHKVKGSRLVTATESYPKQDFSEENVTEHSGIESSYSGLKTVGSVGSRFVARKRKLDETFEEETKAFRRTSVPEMLGASGGTKQWTVNKKQISKTQALIREATGDGVSKTTEVKRFDNIIANSPVKHSNSLSSSLDTALNSVLSTLPSFTTSSSTITKENLLLSEKETLCSSCQNSIQGDTITKYKLPCGHFICRKCVHLNVTSHCKMCNAKYSSDEVIRVF